MFRPVALVATLVLLVGVPAGAIGISVVNVDDPTGGQLVLAPGESARVAVIVHDIPAPGLAAFQFDIGFDSSVITLADPNQDFSATFDMFVPLGGNAFCPIVRDEAACPDPVWFLTETGRAAVLASQVLDNATGFLQMAYGTQPGDDPSVGDGTLALIDVIAGPNPGQTVLDLRNVILSDNGEPPMSIPADVMGLAVVVVPEPATGLLLGLGLCALAARGRRP